MALLPAHDNDHIHLSAPHSRGPAAIPELGISGPAGALHSVLLYYSFASNVRSSLVGTFIILAGIPVYLYFRTANRKAV
jgi:hypothetical protein